MPLILGTNSIKDTGYNVDNSLRFDKASSDYLTRTPSSAGNRKTFTFSFWIKRSKLSGGGTLFTAGAESDTEGFFAIYFVNADNLRVTFNESSSQETTTNAVFRDPSAWSHIVVAVDTTQGTASNRVKVYHNGTQITNFSGENYPSQDYQCLVNNTNANRVGAFANSSGAIEGFFNGYMAEVVLIDGTALDPTSFGEFDSDSPTIWKPIDVSGLTFGTNGFYLDFENASSLGADVSGNGNNFTVNNLTSVDQSTDTCTNNFATMNPLDVPASNQPTFSEGNLKVVSPSASGDNNFGGASTIAVSSGKWYIEAKATVGAGGYSRNRIGITGNESTARINNSLGANSYEYFYDSESGNSNAGSYGNSYTTGDIIGIALNLDDNELKFYKNGTVQNSGTAISIDAPSSTSIGAYKIAQSDSSGVSGATSTFEFNFGSPPYSISSGNSDGNGYGNFEYSVPSGYYALNSKNLAEFG
jgi:hypothetical protein